MTSNRFKVLLFVVVFFATTTSYGQLPPPDGEDPMPITEWLLVLAASGAVYGFRKKIKK
ncbi:hypothetical protein [Ascidiimonas sp. W6]|uniref:hypothetical protein n=1 Tax=Ascidiimonas meishanensis TaxID=3128903 RepID=UPI0030EB2858